MKSKERFVCDNNDYIIDFEDKEPRYCLPQDYVAELLNKQSEQIRTLEERLKNSITPRFNKGSLVCYISDEKLIIDNCTIDKIKVYGTIESYWRKVKIQYKLTYKTKYFDEDELFATREEAEKRLAELEGK